MLSSSEGSLPFRFSNQNTVRISHVYHACYINNQTFTAAKASNQVQQNTIRLQICVYQTRAINEFPTAYPLIRHVPSMSFQLHTLWFLIKRWATGWTIGVLGFASCGGWEFFCSPPRPERLWGPPSLLSNAYQGLFPWG
jgi:hypothetical protein